MSDTVEHRAVSESPRDIIKRRLWGASLSENRFIDVADGQKKSFDHSFMSLPESGNYGIYARGNDSLVLIDIDDYKDEFSNRGVESLQQLPATLEQSSAHGGTHRIYRVSPTDDGKLVADIIKAKFGCHNPSPSWGEVRAHNQYIVGAGSKLTCHDNCRYSVQADRAIATIDASALVNVLDADPDIERSDTKNTDTNTETDSDTSGSRSDTGVYTGTDDVDTDTDVSDIDARLQIALNQDEKLRQLWIGDYSDYRTSNGVDRSRAESALAGKLAFWFDKDKRIVRKLMDQADTRKWCERQDAAYRDSVLEAVDNQSETYSGSTSTATDGGAVTTQQPPDDVAQSKKEHPTLSRQSLRQNAGLGDDESIHDLTDRMKAALTWELIKESEHHHIRATENDEILAYDVEKGIWVGSSDGSERILKEACRKPLPMGAYGSNVFEQLKSIIEADPEGFVARDELGVGANKIVVQNGVLDIDVAYRHLSSNGNVDTSAISELSPTDFAVSQLDYEFNPDASAHQWQSFVDDVIEDEMIPLVQEYLGTCLFDGHLAEKALLMVGDGSNGKSTFLNIIRKVFGQSNVCSLTPSDFRDKNAQARMQNKTINIAAEISGQTLQGEALNRFKNHTGDDSVLVERKYEQPFNLNFTGGMLFASNDAPDISHVDDGDVAFWRRWETVSFPNSFPAGSEKRDPDIEDRLTQDDNLSAILNWLLIGYGRFRHENDCSFTNSRTHVETQTIWQSWGDALDRFLNTVAEKDTDAEDISTSEAFDVFKQWCRSEGETVDMTQSSFTPQAKKKSLGYSTGIDTARDSSVNGFTAFGTSDEFDDPIDIVENDSDGSNSGTNANSGIDDFENADDGASDSGGVSDDGETDIGGETSGSEPNHVANQSTDESDTDGVQSGTNSDLSTEPSDTIDVSDWSDNRRYGTLTGKLENRNEPLSLKALQSKLQWDRDEVIKCVSQLQSRGTVRDTGDGFVLMD